MQSQKTRETTAKLIFDFLKQALPGKSSYQQKQRHQDNMKPKHAFK